MTISRPCGGIICHAIMTEPLADNLFCLSMILQVVQNPLGDNLAYLHTHLCYRKCNKLKSIYFYLVLFIPLSPSIPLLPLAVLSSAACVIDISRMHAYIDIFPARLPFQMHGMGVWRAVSYCR